MAPSTESWTIAPDADLRWRCWDDEFVIYHPPSGDTHILNPLAAEALRHLQRAAGTADDLVRHIAGLFELPADDDLHTQIQQCLASFANLGLIVRR